MRIGIEAQRIFRAKKYGIDRVGIELIKQLQKIDKQNHYYIFTRPGPDKKAIQETSNFKIITISAPNYPIWEQFALPKAVKRFRCDLLHCTSNTAPIFISIPILLTLHDVIFMEQSLLKTLFRKSSYYQKLGNVYRQLIVPLVIHQSTQVVTVSEFEKEKIHQCFPSFKTANITVAYNGVSNHFGALIDSDMEADFRLKYKLPKEFFFFIGGKDPRKNTVNVLRAFGLFHAATNTNIKLVVLHHTQQEIKRILLANDNIILEKQIISIGYVNDRDLSYFYSLSTVFLFPSLREGFGIPVIEAMACGTAVITSKGSSLPEVAGDAACFVNPEDPDSIAQALHTIYHNTTLRDDLINKGYLRSQYFSWHAMAKKILAIYPLITRS